MIGKNPNSKRSTNFSVQQKSENGNFRGESFVTFEPPVNEICIWRKIFGANHTPEILVFRRADLPRNGPRGKNNEQISLGLARVELSGGQTRHRPDKAKRFVLPCQGKAPSSLSNPIWVRPERVVNLLQIGAGGPKSVNRTRKRDRSRSSVFVGCQLPTNQGPNKTQQAPRNIGLLPKRGGTEPPNRVQDG